MSGAVPAVLRKCHNGRVPGERARESEWAREHLLHHHVLGEAFTEGILQLEHPLPVLRIDVALPLALRLLWCRRVWAAEGVLELMLKLALA